MAERGAPRVQYERTYVLLPPGTGAAWMRAVLDATHDKYRYTAGGSADDAGVGDLDTRCVIAINPGSWPSDIQAFFTEYYPGVTYQVVTASTPAELFRKLGGTQPQPSLPTFTLCGVHDRAGADWLLTEGLQGWAVLPVYLGTSAQDLHLERYADAGIRVIVRLNYSYAVDDGGGGTMPGPAELLAFERACIRTAEANPCAWGLVYCNEMNNTREHPKNFALDVGYYVESYNRVWAQKPPHCRLSPGAIDPYNPGWGDWRVTWGQALHTIGGCDFLALHAYTHDSDLNRIHSNECFTHEPLTGVFYDLRVLESQQAIIPARFADRPIVVTEANHYLKSDGRVGWDDDAGWWVREVYKYFGEQSVAGAVMFRYNFDQWRFSDNASVLNALKSLAG